jgi:hypothetical protein
MQLFFLLHEQIQCDAILNWSVHVKKLERESQFHRIHQMSYMSFKKLLHMLTPYLQVNAKQGSCCNQGMGYVSS